MTDFRALCAELVDCLEKANWPLRHKTIFEICLHSARSALAQPEPEEQVLARVKFAEREFNCPSDIVLRQYCDDWFYGDPERSEVDPVDLCRGAIKLFAQIPATIPVSERPPVPEDCDGEGRCWLLYRSASMNRTPTWSLVHRRSIFDADYTDWLPHWALPVPNSNSNAQGE
jgi:hypothetical protein